MLIVLGILLIGLVSAQPVEKINIGDLLNQIDVSTMVTLIAFIVSFALLFYSLSRMLKGNRGIAGIVSLAMAALIAYGIYKSGIDFEKLIQDIGITLEVLHIIFPIFIIGLVIIFIIFIFLRTGKKARKQLRES